MTRWPGCGAGGGSDHVGGGVAAAAGAAGATAAGAGAAGGADGRAAGAHRHPHRGPPAHLRLHVLPVHALLGEWGPPGARPSQGCPGTALTPQRPPPQPAVRLCIPSPRPRSPPQPGIPATWLPSSLPDCLDDVLPDVFSMLPHFADLSTFMIQQVINFAKEIPAFRSAGECGHETPAAARSLTPPLAPWQELAHRRPDLAAERGHPGDLRDPVQHRLQRRDQGLGVRAALLHHPGWSPG